MIMESNAWLPVAFGDWMPVTQAAALGFATFVQEDLPTVTAAVLASAGKLGLWPGFLGCFFGIWLGDMLLYLAARTLGRPLMAWSWSRRWINPSLVLRSEKWFATKGTWLLVSSRFVPGTRLPTYIAAGFLRVPARRFILVTGIVVAVWTTLIFLAAHILGVHLGVSLRTWNRNGWVLLGVIALGFATAKWAPRTAGLIDWRIMRTRAERWTRWEFWPAWLFYIPVGIHYLWLAVRHRGWTLPSAANPGIAAGGLVGESKFQILRLLQASSPESTAESWPLDSGTLEERLERLQKLRADCGLEYPYILKPDIGQRGAGVKLIRTDSDALDYLSKCEVPLVVQRYAAGPLEAGVFYFRFPDEERGHIFAITEKIFPMVTGDGRHTLEELIWHDDRARFMAGRYLTRLGDRRGYVPNPGEQVKLVETGNHAQGCIFRDGARWRTPQLEWRIDAISHGVDGFYVGRYDIRFESEADLRQGRNFQIIELNGASSEATSIYDSRNSLWSAYKTLFKQWELVFAIGAANRRRGIAPVPIRELLRTWRLASRASARYPIAD